MGPGDWTQFFELAWQTLYPLSISPAPQVLLVGLTPFLHPCSLFLGWYGSVPSVHACFWLSLEKQKGSHWASLCVFASPNRNFPLNKVGFFSTNETLKTSFLLPMRSQPLWCSGTHLACALVWDLFVINGTICLLSLDNSMCVYVCQDILCLWQIPETVWKRTYFGLHLFLNWIVPARAEGDHHGPESMWWSWVFHPMVVRKDRVVSGRGSSTAFSSQPHLPWFHHLLTACSHFQSLNGLKHRSGQI